MNPERNEVRIFNAALELAAPAERAAFLDRACAGDEPLRRKVDALLQACGEAEDYFQTIADPFPPAEGRQKPAGPTGTALLPVTEKPGDRIGRYKLRERLGEGGCGVVYVAEQEEPVRRRVALKVIKLGMDTKSVVARFEAERQALAMMDHPNIAKVLDAGATDTGRPYFVMELVRGIKITDYCDQNNLSTGERLDLFTKVCHAVQHAHQKGIIHRDLKPSNILVTLHDGVPVPKVIDFGIAKATEGRLTDATVYTELHQFIGTPAYMSPEQAEMSGLDIDTRADIYSLGVLLYELLTGQPPFSAEELMRAGVDEMRRTIREKEPVRPSTRLSTMLEGERTAVARRHGADALKLVHLLRGDLDWIVMKALEKDRTRRYETANGFAQDIQRHLTSEPVIARPPSALYRFRKAYRRNRIAFTAAACVLASMFVAMCGIWVAAQREGAARVRESIQRNAAEQQREQARAERDRAVRAEAGARQMTAEANQNLVKLNVAEGWRRVEEGDFFGALLPFAEAFALEEHKPERAEIHQMRLAGVLQRSPKLVNVWSVGSIIHQAEFSRDGKRLLVVGVDGRDSRARIWDCATGQPLTEPMRHERAIRHVHWSDDETKVATASWDKTARVWDARTGQPLTPPLLMNGSVIWTDFDFSGARLATLSWKDPGDNDEDFHPNGQLAVWDVSTGRALWITNAPVLDTQDFVMFSPQGSEVITTAEMRWAEDGTAVRQLKHHSWKLDSGSSATWDEEWSVNSHRAAFSPDGSRLFIAPSPCRYYYSRNSQKAQAVLLDGQELSREIGKLNTSGRPRLGQFSLDGRRIATANEGFMARVWDSATGSPVSPPLRHLGRVDALAFSDDGRKLATATDRGMARIWDAESGEPLSPPMPHRSGLLRLTFIAGDTQLMTVGRDGTVSLWDFRSADVPTFTWQKSSYNVGLNSDSRRQVINLDLARPKLFNLHDGSPILPPLKLPELSVEGWDASYGPGFSSDGSLVFGAVGYRSHQFLWPSWNLATGQCRTNWIDVHSTARSTNFVEWSSDRRFVLIAGPGVSSGEKAHYRVWDTSTGRAVIDGMMHRVRFSPDGNWILGVQTNGMTGMWSAQDGELKTEFGEKDSVRRDIVTDARATRMVTAGTNGLDVWDTQSRQRLGQVRGETVFSADGEYLATWEARRVNLYRVTNRVELVRTLEHPMNSKWPVRENMVFSPNSKVLMTRDELGTMRLWSVPDGDLIRQQAIGPEGRVHVSPDGQGLIDTALENEVRFWSLKSVQRSSGDWKAVAAFFSLDKPSDRSSENEPAAANPAIETGHSRTNRSSVAAWSSMRRIFPEAFHVTAQELEGWHRHRAARFEAAQDWTNAIHHLSRLLEAQPNHGEFLPRRAEAQVSWARWLATNAHPQPALVTNVLERALDDYSRTLAWVDRFPAVAAESRRVYLRSRSDVSRKLGRLRETRLDLEELNRISPRPPGTSPDLIDLSAHYNESLPAWFVPGTRELATGVKYDLRAGIELGTGWDEYPSQVTGIQVGRSGRRLHFLHWVTHCNACPDNEVGQKTGDFARVTIHLANGDRHMIQLRLVEDVWYHGGMTGEAAVRHHSRVVLDEPRYGDCPRHPGTRWFQRTWENPKPGVAIERVDIESISESVWVRLYAMTVEP